MKKVNLKEATKRDWSIQHFTVSEEEAKRFNFSLIFSGHGSRSIRAGEYTKLVHKERGVVMSDTPAEMSDHSYFVRKAKGSVLINGLGLGMVLYNCALKEEVSKITVIEIDADIIELVGSQYKNQFDGKLNIIHSDALEYIPPKGIRYDCVWHDIWDNICLDNWEEYKKLHRKYGRRCNYQNSWCRWELQQQLREEKSYSWY
jgi:hypothetical protein